jgi:hypothetical protein
VCVYIAPQLRRNGVCGRETSQKCPSSVSDNILAALIYQMMCLSNILIENYEING